MLNNVVRYFDLRSPTGNLRPARGPAAPAKKCAAAPSVDHAAVLPQYGAATLGVLATAAPQLYRDAEFSRSLSPALPLGRASPC